MRSTHFALLGLALLVTALGCSDSTPKIKRQKVDDATRGRDAWVVLLAGEKVGMIVHKKSLYGDETSGTYDVNDETGSPKGHIEATSGKVFDYKDGAERERPLRADVTHNKGLAEGAKMILDLRGPVTVRFATAREMREATGK